MRCEPGLWAALLISLPIMPFSLYGEHILLALGQAPAAAHLAQQYLFGLVWGVTPALWFMAIRGFMGAVNRPQPALWITLGAIPANALLVYLLIYGEWGLPRLELFGAGLATTMVNFGTVLASLWFATRRRPFRKYHVLGHIWRIDGRLMRQLVAIGAPISMSFMMEYGLFSAAALLMGLISTTALAAHQVALQVTAILFMVPYGISMAATVRVGHAVGRNDPSAVKRAGLVAILLGIVLVAGFTLAVIASRFAIARLFFGVADGCKRCRRADRHSSADRRHLLYRRWRPDHRGRIAARHERYAGAAVVCRHQLLADRIYHGVPARFPDRTWRDRRLDRVVGRDRDLCDTSDLAFPLAGEQACLMIRVHEVAPEIDAGPLLSGAQFIDAFRVDLEGRALDARNAAERMMGHSPAWIEALLTLRNVLVAPFGLKTSGKSENPPRETIGLFPILTQTPDRLVAGFNDKHLDFRVVVDVAAPGADSEAGQQVTATTLVKTHNVFGRIYLAIILPFHRLIVPAMLRKVAVG